MMKWLRNLKSKICNILSDSHGEIIGSDVNVYFINGVRYVVSSQFSTTEEKTLKDKLSDFIGSNFAQLTKDEERNTMQEDYFCLTAGKEVSYNLK
ncbi:MAG: hypothetical protein ACI4GB_06625 [Acutalibacteraceae bacterium]